VSTAWAEILEQKKELLSQEKKSRQRDTGRGAYERAKLHHHWDAAPSCSKMDIGTCHVIYVLREENKGGAKRLLFVL
jgi:hypothetical protein